MAFFSRFQSRKWLFVAALLVLVAVLMLHPYPRQSLFGPTVRGKPRCVWEDAIHFQCAENRNYLFERVRRWLGIDRWPTSEENLFDHPEMLPIVVAMLDDPDAGVRMCCMMSIRDNPCLRDRSALPALRKRLQEDEIELRFVAGQAIWHIDKDEQVLRWFRDLLNHEDAGIRFGSLRGVSALCVDVPELYPDIIAHAKDSDEWVRAEVMYAMRHFGKKGVPILIDGMNDTDGGVRSAAILIAQSLGPDAKEAVPAIESRLKDVDGNVAVTAGHALRAIDPGTLQTNENGPKVKRPVLF